MERENQLVLWAVLINYMIFSFTRAQREIVLHHSWLCIMSCITNSMLICITSLCRVSIRKESSICVFRYSKYQNHKILRPQVDNWLLDQVSSPMRLFSRIWLRIISLEKVQIDMISLVPTLLVTNTAKSHANCRESWPKIDKSRKCRK